MSTRVRSRRRSVSHVVALLRQLLFGIRSHRRLTSRLLFTFAILGIAALIAMYMFQSGMIRPLREAFCHH